MKTWTQVGVSFEFTGDGTTVSFYKDDSIAASFIKSEIYLEDKSSYSGAFLMMSARQRSNGTYAASSVFSGFMYNFKYFVTLGNHASDGRATTSCTGDVSCSVTGCPSQARGKSYN